MFDKNWSTLELFSIKIRPPAILAKQFVIGVQNEEPQIAADLLKYLTQKGVNFSTFDH